MRSWLSLIIMRSLSSSVVNHLYFNEAYFSVCCRVLSDTETTLLSSEMRSEGIYIPTIELEESDSLPMDRFKEMDSLAIDKYQVPIELMMENAGLNLARLIALNIVRSERVLIGVGKGNNGGGGLVAARRLAGWGFNVCLDIPEKQLNPLPTLQLKRAISFGASLEKIKSPDLVVDAYLGFSQHLPLSSTYSDSVTIANQYQAFKISLDIPTGLDPSGKSAQFQPDIILTLAAVKKELLIPAISSDILLADIGIPSQLYTHFNIRQPDFSASSLLKLSRLKTNNI